MATEKGSILADIRELVSYFGYCLYKRHLESTGKERLNDAEIEPFVKECLTQETLSNMRAYVRQNMLMKYGEHARKTVEQVLNEITSTASNSSDPQFDETVQRIAVESRKTQGDM